MGALNSKSWKRDRSHRLSYLPIIWRALFSPRQACIAGPRSEQPRRIQDAVCTVRDSTDGAVPGIRLTYISTCPSRSRIVDLLRLQVRTGEVDVALILRTSLKQRVEIQRRV